MGADEWHFPAIIPRDVLERAEFFESFAPLATSVVAGHPPHQPEAAPHLLSTAVCYHIYPQLGGRTLAADRPLLLTAAGECYRHESEALQPLARQWAFQMREIVVFGTPEQVHDLRRVLIERTGAFATALRLRARIEPATDPFFGPQSRGKALLQQVKGLKHELRAPVEQGDLAIASFNDHEDFFGRAFDIRLEGGAFAHSGCVAFGLERWVYALLCRHGPAAAPWDA
jgi:seryl-tRNA synthetase